MTGQSSLILNNELQFISTTVEKISSIFLDITKYIIKENGVCMEFYVDFNFL